MLWLCINNNIKQPVTEIRTGLAFTLASKAIRESGLYISLNMEDKPISLRWQNKTVMY